MPSVNISKISVNTVTSMTAVINGKGPLLYPVHVQGDGVADEVTFRTPASELHLRIGGNWRVGTGRDSRLDRVKAALDSGRRVFLVGIVDKEIRRCLEIIPNTEVAKGFGRYVHAVAGNAFDDNEYEIIEPTPKRAYSQTGEQFAVIYRGQKDKRAKYVTTLIDDSALRGKKFNLKVEQNPALFEFTDTGYQNLPFLAIPTDSEHVNVAELRELVDDIVVGDIKITSSNGTHHTSLEIVSDTTPATIRINPGDIILRKNSGTIVPSSLLSNPSTIDAVEKYIVIREKKDNSGVVQNYLQSEEGKCLLEQAMKDNFLDFISEISIPIQQLIEDNQQIRNEQARQAQVQAQHGIELQQVRAELIDLRDELSKRFLDVTQEFTDLREQFAAQKINVDEQQRNVDALYATLDDLSAHQDRIVALYHPNIRAWLDDHWSHLEEQSKTFLSTAELLFDTLVQQGAGNFDFAPFIMQYCRALESEMFNKLFQQYRDSLGENAQRIIQEEQNNRQSHHQRKLIAFIGQQQPLSLAEMAIILGNASNPRFRATSPLLRHFHKFATPQKFNGRLFQDNFATETRRLASDFRNPAAHIGPPFTQDQAEECRNLLRPNLRTFMSAYNAA